MGGKNEERNNKQGYSEGGRDVEIFCNKQYKGYYVRGLIRAIFHYIHDDPYERECAAVDYRYATLALVNDNYQERIEKQWKEDYPPPFFSGNIEKDYLNAVRNCAKKSGRRDISWVEQMIKKYLHRTFTISLDEAEITQNQYLEDSIKKAKDIILLHADFVVNKAKTLVEESRMLKYVERIYIIPAFYFPKRDEYDSDVFSNWFEKEYDLFHIDFGCDYPTKREYCRILKSIGSLSYEWIKQREITRDCVNRLNKLNGSMGKRTYPVMNFCGQFLDDLIDDLTAQRKIRKCLRCKDFFEYNPRVAHKKFCSFASEGKDCGKKAGYKRWYEKHKNEVRLKQKEEMRDTRAVYKEHGL